MMQFQSRSVHRKLILASNTSLKTNRWFCKFLWSQNSYIYLGTPAVCVQRQIRPDTLTTVMTFWTWFLLSILETFRWQRLVLSACAEIAASVTVSACMERAAHLNTGDWAKIADLVLLRTEQRHSCYFPQLYRAFWMSSSLLLLQPIHNKFALKH